MISQREQGVEAVGAEVARSGRAQGRRQWSVGDDEGIGGQRRSFGSSTAQRFRSTCSYSTAVSSSGTVVRCSLDRQALGSRIS